MTPFDEAQAEVVACLENDVFGRFLSTPRGDFARRVVAPGAAAATSGASTGLASLRAITYVERHAVAARARDER